MGNVLFFLTIDFFLNFINFREIKYKSRINAKNWMKNKKNQIIIFLKTLIMFIWYTLKRLNHRKHNKTFLANSICILSWYIFSKC